MMYAHNVSMQQAQNKNIAGKKKLEILQYCDGINSMFFNEL